MDHPYTAEDSVKRIARLNDESRSMLERGEVLMTTAVKALPEEVQAAALAVRTFDAFTQCNDPREEDDFDSFDFAGVRRELHACFHTC
jgi:hypothetical protein